MMVNAKTQEGRTVMVLTDWQAHSKSASHRAGRRKGKQVYKKMIRAKEKRAWKAEAVS